MLSRPSGGRWSSGIRLPMDGCGGLTISMRIDAPHGEVSLQTRGVPWPDCGTHLSRRRRGVKLRTSVLDQSPARAFERGGRPRAAFAHDLARWMRTLMQQRAIRCADVGDTIDDRAPVRRRYVQRGPCEQAFAGMTLRRDGGVQQ